MPYLPWRKPYCWHSSSDPLSELFQVPFELPVAYRFQWHGFVFKIVGLRDIGQTNWGRERERERQRQRQRETERPVVLFVAHGCLHSSPHWRLKSKDNDKPFLRTATADKLHYTSINLKWTGYESDQVISSFKNKSRDSWYDNALSLFFELRNNFKNRIQFLQWHTHEYVRGGCVSWWRSRIVASWVN